MHQLPRKEVGWARPVGEGGFDDFGAGRGGELMLVLLRQRFGSRKGTRPVASGQRTSVSPFVRSARTSIRAWLLR